MRNNRVIVFYLFPALFFLSLALFSLRKVIFTPGLIGFTWDWDIPPFPAQILEKMKLFFYAWSDIPNLGMTLKMASHLYYWLIVAPFGFFGGGILIKVALIIIFILAGLSMLELSNVLGFRRIVGMAISVFYMFTPFMYSRIIAGHLPVAFGYALLPLFIAFFLRSMQEDRIRYRYIILSGAVFSFVAQHPLLMVIAFVILVVFTGMEFHFAKKKSVPLISCFCVLFIFVLFHSFWLFPFIMKIAGGQQIAHGGMSNALSKVSLETELLMRQGFLKSTSLQVSDALRMLAGRQGMDVEHVFPVSQALEPFFIVASFLIPVFVFLTLILKKKTKEYFSFLLIAILGITLLTGIRTPMGYSLYYLVLYRLGWVFAEFSNPNRWSPLVAISYAALLGYFLDSVIKKKIDRRLLAIPFLSIVFYVSPFLSSDLNRRIMSGSQPLSLLITRINKQDKEVYDFIKREAGDFRVSYLPPASLAYVGVPELSYEWTTFYSPKPEFMAYCFNGEPFSQFCVATLFQKKLKSAYLGKIIGLASTRYIIFPKYKEYYLYSPIDRIENAGIGEIAYLSENRLENTLKLQNDIFVSDKLPDVDTVILYENKNWLEHLYVPENIIFASGDFSSLVSASFMPYLDFGRNSFVFVSNLDKQKLQMWNNPAPFKYLIYNNNHMDFFLPYLKDNELIYPGKFYSHVADFSRGWGNLAFMWYYDWYHSASLEKANGVYANTASSCRVPYYAPDSQRYEVYALVHKGPLGSRLCFSIRDIKIGCIDTKTISDLGFVWDYVGNIYLGKGEHSLVIENKKGENALLALIIATKDRITALEEASKKQMSQEELLLLGEMEGFGVPQVDKDASIGNAITPALKAGIYSPSGKEYNLFLRIKSGSKSLVKLDLKGTARTIKIDNNMNKYKIYDAGSFYLKEGINELVISSAGGENVFIDSYLFVSKAIHPEKDYGSSQIFNYKKLSPTKYIIHSKSKTPFFLFFSERFDPKWQLKYRGKEFRHIMANGFANLYYIDEAGEGSLVLEYSDQNYFVLGQIITVVSWIMLLAVLIYFIRYSKIKLNDK